MGHSLRRENILDPRVAAAGPFWHAPRKWRRPVTSRNPRLCTASTGGSKREENGKEGHQGSRGWLASLDWSAGRMEGVVESCRFISISRSRLVRGRRDTPVNRSCLRGERASSSSFNPWPNLSTRQGSCVTKATDVAKLSFFFFGYFRRSSSHMYFQSVTT